MSLIGAAALGACHGGLPAPPATLPATDGIDVTAPPHEREPRLLGEGTYGALSTAPMVTFLRAPSDTATAKLVLHPANPFGEPVPLLVAGARRDADGDPWLRVYLPVRPNDSTGWIRGSDVRLVPQHEEIVVDLSSRTLRHYRDGRLVDRFSVGVGRPAFPTPKGTFYVTVRVPQASSSGPYGVFALGISAYSDVLTDWPGGGQVAIHGTANPGDQGERVSHGCVRVYNPDMLTIRHVPLGTPVIVRR